MYPSGYAYHKDSVNESEPASANCRMYSSGLDRGLGSNSADYIHCNGAKLRLSDSDVEPRSQYYVKSEHYEWNAGTETRFLLFIFPTRFNLTTITLHYYSNNNNKGLPKLELYAAPDDFNVWGAPPGNNRSILVDAVPPGKEPVGHSNVSINATFSTKKVLMAKLGSSYTFAVSEVEFQVAHCGEYISA